MFAVLVSLLVLAGIAVLAKGLFDAAVPDHEPLPGEERCVATASGQSVAVDTEQAHYAAVISGLSVRRGLAPRAASIALATAYQESGIRNLDHGDRDSLGLFQQRPSMGWGTEEQLQNPYFATNAFYDALIKVEDWEAGDITEIAQNIQISAYPDAYRAHESDARVLASVLTGHSPAGIRCLVRDSEPGDVKGLTKSLRKTYQIKPKRAEKTITVKADSAGLAWSYAHYAVANAQGYGVERVQVGGQQLIIDDMRLPQWQDVEPIGKRTVRITVG
jgi:hypothetical protein